MSKGQMPGSMDLLLDTMCNTFGGVMFIAISLSLAFFVAKTQNSPADDLARVQQNLKEEKEETLLLEAKKNSLTKTVLSLKKFSSQYTESKSDLPEVVAKLELQRRNLKREWSILSLEFSEVEAKKNSLQKKNKRLEAEVREEQKRLKEKEKQLRREHEKVCSIVDHLSRELESIPVKRFHFAHNQLMTCVPYWVIIQNNRLYRWGVKDSPWGSSQEVQVTRDGNKLRLSPLDGRELSSLSAEEFSSFFQANQPFFLNVFVNPDSFAAFVPFRRMLREKKYRVNWSVDSNYVVTLVSHADYSASD